ncbi:MAG: RagB/SusD family nutrient uptake outer membrane protein [Cyclobacteriaceae bacterium]
MKQIKIFFLVVTVLMASSCNEDDFLTEVNPNAITPDTFWKSADDFDTALNTVYAALQSNYVSGSQIAYELIRGDEGNTHNWYRPYSFMTMTFNDNTKQVRERWNDLYVGVYRANQVIAALQTTSAEFEAGEKKSIEAQARFIRAFYYFQIAHTYGKAVVHTTTVSDLSELNRPAEDIATVNAQVIIPDLEYAAENLPEEWTGEDLGRVTSGAATTMLGKVALFNQEWAKAAAYFKEVIDSGTYSLVADPRDNWTDVNEFNSESIMEVGFNIALKPGTNGAAVDSYGGGADAEANGIVTEIAPLAFGGFNTVFPSIFLHELFEYDEMNPDDARNINQTQSLRMRGSIVTLDADELYYGKPADDGAAFNIGMTAFIKKWTNWYQVSSEDQGRSGINFRHIRLADVYLMYAEAILEAQGDAALTEAMSYVDMIRDRSGVITLSDYMEDNSGQIPEFHNSPLVNGGVVSFTTANAQSLLTHIRMVERPLELCFETHRWKDLVRWGIAGQVIDQQQENEQWRIDNIDDFRSEPPMFISETRNDWGLPLQNYNPAAHNYLPIPTDEVQINNQLDGGGN